MRRGDFYEDDELPEHVEAAWDRGTPVEVNPVKPCPTPCDDDCKADCHEAHNVPWKRQHDPDSHQAQGQPGSLYGEAQ